LAWLDDRAAAVRFGPLDSEYVHTGLTLAFTLPERTSGKQWRPVEGGPWRDCHLVFCCGLWKTGTVRRDRSTDSSRTLIMVSRADEICEPGRISFDQELGN